MRCGGGGCAAATFFQSCLQIRMGGLERGNESESECYKDDGDGGEEEDAEVHAHAHRLNRVSGQQMTQPGDAPRSQDDAEDAAAECEDEAFGEHLTNEAAAAGAECLAQRDFACARGAAHQEQIGNVDAGDRSEEHTSE